MNTKIFSLITLLLVSPFAIAAESAEVNPMGSYVMLALMFVMIYFLMIRPQSKKAKEHREMISSISVGDEVVTQGGLLGKIIRDADTFFIISLGTNVEFPIQKNAVQQLLPKGTINSI